MMCSKLRLQDHCPPPPGPAVQRPQAQMPMGKEVSGYRGHLRPAWERLAPEGLNYCLRGTSSISGRRAADSSSRAAHGVLSQGTASCPPLTPITETRCMCERGAPCSEEPVGWAGPGQRAEDSHGLVMRLPCHPRACRQSDAPAARIPAHPSLRFLARAPRFPSRGLSAPGRTPGAGSAPVPASGVEAK